MNPKNKKIVIIESTPTDMMAKISIGLRKNNYNTFLLSITGNTNSDFLKKAYSKIFSLNFQFMRVNYGNLFPIISLLLKQSIKIFLNIKKVKELNPDIIILRTTPNWLFFLIKKLFRKIPVIYFPYDIRSFCYKDLKESRKAKVPNFEIKSEEWAFNNADGIIHKGHHDELKKLNKKILRNLKINCPLIHFLPYCLNDLMAPLNKNKLSKKDNELHIVFVGHVDLSSTWIDSIKSILDDEIHLHLYDKNAYIKSEKSEKYLSLPKNKYLHIHPPVDQKDLSREISKYDYAIWLGNYNVTKKSISTATGNKLASHLEAGIPTIHYKNHEYIGELCKEYGIGIGIEFNTNLKKLLSKKDYKKFEKRILEARKTFEINYQIPRMIKFFKEVENFYRKRK